MTELKVGSSFYTTEYGKKLCSKSKELTGISIGPDGSFDAYMICPKIKRIEQEDFLYRSLMFYELALPNGTKALLLRGAMNYDVILDPYACVDYPATRENFLQGSSTFMVQADSAKDKLTALRMSNIPSDVRKRIIDIFDNNTRFDPDTLELSLLQYIFPYSPNKLVELADYIGKDQDVLLPRNVVLPLI